MQDPEELQRELVTAWLAKAQDDLLGARQLRDAPRPNYDLVGFIAQQAVEKFLKAFLIRHQIEFPKTRDIGALLLLAGKRAPGISEALAGAEALAPYAVELRYPHRATPMDQTRAAWAVATAAAVRQYVLDAMKDYLPAGRPSDPKEEKP